jgi:glycosyltransferase involved in cell wall biosynthesis
VTTHVCVVALLTFNSEPIVRETVSQALKVCPRIFAVDSGSTDGTVSVLKELGCEVVHRQFANYSDQRNWTIATLQSSSTWQLHLDADEVLDDTAVAEIRRVLNGHGSHPAYMLKRRDYFMGRMLRFSGVNPWHLRLFRSGSARCESRLYDQHFVSAAPAGRLRGFMHDKNALNLRDWTERHNRWSDLETQELLSMQKRDSSSVLQARLTGDARERTRYLKGLYYRLPAGLRPFLYFTYRYFGRLGFLDGRPGFYFALLQGFWFRVLVDAKLQERRLLDEDVVRQTRSL